MRVSTLRIAKKKELTRIFIVAHSEVRFNTSSIRQTIRTILRSATDRSSTFPHDLRHVAVLLKVGHVGIWLTVQFAEVGEFRIVPEFGDGAGDVGG